MINFSSAQLLDPSVAVALLSSAAHGWRKKDKGRKRGKNFWKTCDLIPESADALYSAMCFCTHMVFTAAMSVECLTFCRWNNGARSYEPALGREECCGGLNDLFSVWPLHPPILINEIHRGGKQPCNNTGGAAF